MTLCLTYTGSTEKSQGIGIVYVMNCTNPIFTSCNVFQLMNFLYCLSNNPVYIFLYFINLYTLFTELILYIYTYSDDDDDDDEEEDGWGIQWCHVFCCLFIMRFSAILCYIGVTFRLQWRKYEYRLKTFIYPSHWEYFICSSVDSSRT